MDDQISESFKVDIPAESADVVGNCSKEATKRNETWSVPKKTKLADLHLLNKEDLVDRIRQLEFHVNQLKNVIAKGNGGKTGRSKPKQRPFDFTKHNKRHVVMKIAYLGWDYKGFVVQEDTNKTIEHALFDALITARLIESRETSNYHRCGRTDKGVSAFCQVISIDLRSVMSSGIGVIKNPNAPESPTKEKEIDYTGILNRILPEEIRALAWAPVEPEFSARFDCKSRTYKYFFPRGDLNIDLMNEASAKLAGSHDFRNLCKMDVGNGVVNFIRTIDSASVTVSDESSDGYSICTFTIVSKAFLWHQIRCVMALIFMIGKKQENPEIIDELFDVDKNPRKPQYTMASELPLNLFDCTYDGVDWNYDQDEVEKVIAHYQQQWSEQAIKSTMLRAMISNLTTHVPISTSYQADILVSDYRRHTEYRKLLSRTTCSSLEDRKEYFAKRRKLDKCLNVTEKTEGDKL